MHDGLHDRYTRLLYETLELIGFSPLWYLRWKSALSHGGTTWLESVLELILLTEDQTECCRHTFPRMI